MEFVACDAQDNNVKRDICHRVSKHTPCSAADPSAMLFAAVLLWACRNVNDPSITLENHKRDYFITINNLLCLGGEDEISVAKYKVRVRIVQHSLRISFSRRSRNA